MTEQRFALIEFQGDQVLTSSDGETIRVAIKPMAERLGIAWPRQFQKLKDDPVLSKGVTLTVIPSERGAQETITLPLDLMQGWLFKLNPDKVAPEARERVIAYQRECYQVLHDYWVKGAAINPRFGAQLEHSDRTARRRELPGLLDRMERETHLEKRRVLHALIERACEAEGIVPPALDAIAPPTSNEDARADAMLQQIDALIAERPELDHHRRRDWIAVSRPELARHGLNMASRMLPAFRRHPRFVMNNNVNGTDGKHRACWVFRKADPQP